MTPAPRQLLLMVLVAAQSALPGDAATRFTSHISVNTPARSYSHGVGDPVTLHRRSHEGGRSLRRPPPADGPGSEAGYPRVRPAVPFTHEEIPSGNSIGLAPWHYHDFMEVAIPVLPPSPYKVDSPDPESLWPEGLFLPPAAAAAPPRHHHGRRSGETADELLSDPYLVSGSEAVAAVLRGARHGVYYFHDVPHIDSLLAHQDLRSQNNLTPHRIGSIRHTWPYNRP